MSAVAESISIRVNGEDRRVPAGSTVGDLLASLELHPRLVVVEYNRQILPRERLPVTELAQGDALELVHFVGGG